MLRLDMPFRSLAAAAALLAAVAASLPAQDVVTLRRPSGLSPYELQIWNDADFQRRFAESYIAETEIEPRVTESEREIMQEVLDLIAEEEMDEAAELLRRSIDRDPAISAVFDFTLGNIHFQRDELDAAIPAYEGAVEKYPKFRRAWKNLALIHVRQGDHDRAIPALRRVIELGGGDGLTYGLIGFAYTSTQNYLSAESAYRMAILLDPETLDWKLGLAQGFFSQQRYAEAAALCEQLLEENPDRADLWLLKANAHIGLNQPEKAAEIYELVDLMGESTVDSLYMLGDIYINEQLFDLAGEKYGAAVGKEEPGEADRALRSARILSARGAFDATARLIDRIDSHHGGQLGDDERKELLKLEARVAVARGEGDEEVRVLEEIIQIDPLDGEALILLAQHSQRHDDAEQAIFYLERAASIDAFEADAKVRHAQILVGQGKYGEALPLLRRAQQVNYRENVQEYLEQVERVSRTR